MHRQSDIMSDAHQDFTIYISIFFFTISNTFLRFFVHSGWQWISGILSFSCTTHAPLPAFVLFCRHVHFGVIAFSFFDFVAQEPVSCRNTGPGGVARLNYETARWEGRRSVICQIENNGMYKRGSN